MERATSWMRVPTYLAVAPWPLKGVDIKGECGDVAEAAAEAATEHCTEARPGAEPWQVEHAVLAAAWSAAKTIMGGGSKEEAEKAGARAAEDALDAPLQGAVVCCKSCAGQHQKHVPFSFHWNQARFGSRNIPKNRKKGGGRKGGSKRHRPKDGPRF